jgi:hypothetical protein
MFPTDKAQWRLLETRALIERYRTDFLSIQGASTTEFSWEPLVVSHQLRRYDILIFHPQWNPLNKFNHRGFDGTKFNSWPASVNCSPVPKYMLRDKRYRGQPIDFSVYDVVYSMFLDRAYQFAQVMHSLPRHLVPPVSRQVVKAYPGGGARRDRYCCYADPGFPKFVASFKSLLGVNHSRLHIIATQPHMRDFLKLAFPENPLWYPETLAGFYNPPGGDYRHVVQRDHGPIHVCFTTLGPPEVKGTHHYLKLVHAYRERYGNGSVVFHSVGRVPERVGIHHINVLGQSALNEFYKRTPIDVYVNLDLQPGINGWPLGLEAMVQGAVLFSTDELDLNTRGFLRLGGEFTRVRFRNHSKNLAPGVSNQVEIQIQPLLKQLRAYALNRSLLFEHAKATQRRVLELGSAERWGQQYFDYLENDVAQVRPQERVERTPPKKPSPMVSRANPPQRHPANKKKPLPSSEKSQNKATAGRVISRSAHNRVATAMPERSRAPTRSSTSRANV